MNRIFKTLSIFIFVIFSTFCENSFAKDLTPAEIFENVNNNVVVIYSYDFDGNPVKQGSGVVIGDSGYIITNFHVFSECENIIVYHNKIQLGAAEIINADFEQDILIIRLENIDYPGISIANSDNVSVGEKIYAIGSPLGYENTISEGIISGIRRFNNYESSFIQVTASISEGSSGGAIVNSNGELIGISTFQEKNGQNLNFAIPINDVIFFKNSFSYEKNDLEGNKIFIKGYNAYKSLKYEDAIYYYTGYLKLWESGAGYYNRGLAYLKSERYKEAISDFNYAMKINKSDANVYSSRGKAYLEIGEYSKALSDFNYAISLEPDYSYIYNRRGEYYLQVGDFNSAYKDFTTAINMGEDYSVYFYNRGVTNELLKKNINAIDDYSEAIKLYPDYFDALYSRATLFNDMGNYDRSVIDFQKCIDMYPEYKYPYNNLGWTYFNKKDYKNAIFYLQKCYDLDEKDWDSVLGIATTYYVTGKEKQAEKYFNRAKKMEPKLKKGMDGIKLLEKEGYSYNKSQKHILEELFDEFN